MILSAQKNVEKNLNGNGQTYPSTAMPDCKTSIVQLIGLCANHLFAFANNSLKNVAGYDRSFGV